MSRQCIIALKLTQALPAAEGDYIGADKGALYLADHHIQMKLAIGDFDSVSTAEMRQIEKYSQEVIRLNPIKDQSDSEEALNQAISRGYSTIWLAGACGGRMDHTLVNLKLALRCPHRVILFDEKNRIEILRQGTHEIRRGEYPYVSFFAADSAVISLKGMKYPLDHRRLKAQDLYGLSNEIRLSRGLVNVHQGAVIMIQSKD